jgi:hypothetical protein
MKQAIRRMKKEIAYATILSIVLVASISFINLRNLSQESQDSLQIHAYKKESLNALSALSFEQVIRENIVGELQKDSFETVVRELKNLTSIHGGRIPSLQMYYASELWKGELECKIPTDNVTAYTFDVRALISIHGKVTYISISVIEVEVNGTAQQQEIMSNVSISLKEIVEGGQLPFINQLGAVVPVLTTSLVWIAQALIVTVPLSFVLLAIIIMIEKGLVPLWKKQIKIKKTATSITANPAT